MQIRRCYISIYYFSYLYRNCETYILENVFSDTIRCLELTQVIIWIISYVLLQSFEMLLRTMLDLFFGHRLSKPCIFFLFYAAVNCL